MPIYPTDFICGCMGGFLGTLISHPIDTVKTRVQSGHSLAKSILMKKYFRGIKWPFALVPIEKGIVFGTSTFLKSYDVGSFGSGFIAGFASTLIVTPMEYLKINIQNGVQMNIRSINFRQAYNGIIPTICRESPGYAVYIATYDSLDKKFNQEKSLMKSFLFGGLTGLSSWLVIYPTDFVKTKVQDINNTKSIGQIIKSIYNSDVTSNYIKSPKLLSLMKPLNFYNGLGWALGRAIPLHAGVFAGYELSKKFLFSDD